MLLYVVNDQEGLVACIVLSPAECKHLLAGGICICPNDVAINYKTGTVWMRLLAIL